MAILKPIIIKNSLTSLSVSFCNFEKSLNYRAFQFFKMKRILFFYAVLMFTFLANAQEEVVSFTTKYNVKTSEIEITANLLDGWHIYSQHIGSDLGPVPTAFSFEKNNSLSLIGNVNEPKAIHQYDPTFETSVDYFENEVTFKQKINTIQTTNLNGVITYMACNEIRCIPPSDKKFTIKIIK